MWNMMECHWLELLVVPEEPKAHSKSWRKYKSRYHTIHSGYFATTCSDQTFFILQQWFFAVVLVFVYDIFIWKVEWQREGKKRRKEGCAICWFSLSMTTTSRASPSWNQEPGIPSLWVAWTQVPAPFSTASPDGNSVGLETEQLGLEPELW